MLHLFFSLSQQQPFVRHPSLHLLPSPTSQSLTNPMKQVHCFENKAVRIFKARPHNDPLYTVLKIGTFYVWSSSITIAFIAYIPLHFCDEVSMWSCLLFELHVQRYQRVPVFMIRFISTVRSSRKLLKLELRGFLLALYHKATDLHQL